MVCILGCVLFLCCTRTPMSPQTVVQLEIWKDLQSTLLMMYMLQQWRWWMGLILRSLADCIMHWHARVYTSEIKHGCAHLRVDWHKMSLPSVRWGLENTALKPLKMDAGFTSTEWGNVHVCPCLSKAYLDIDWLLTTYTSEISMNLCKWKVVDLVLFIDLLALHRDFPPYRNE